MKISKELVLASNLALVALLCVQTGCATKGYDRAAAAGTALQAAADQISETSTQLTTTMDALNGLVERPQADLRPQFTAFSSALDKLQSLAKDVDARAKDMQAKGRDYFTEWNQQLATIHNEDIRTRSAKRQKEVSAKFDAINTDYQKANAALTPLLADLQDVRTYLSNDLTTGGLDAIKKTVTKAGKEVPDLKKSLGKLASDFKKLGLSISATTPPPAPATQ